MKGTVDQLALGVGDLQIAGNGPVFQGIGIFAHHAFTRAGRVQQDGIKDFRQRRAEYPTIEVGQGHVADPAAADVGMQYLHSAGGEFVGEDRPGVIHPRGNLGGFRPGGGGNVHYPLRLVAVGEEGANRQH